MGANQSKTRIWSNNLRSVQSSASPESELCLLFAGSVGRSSPNFKSSEKQFGLCGSEGPEFKSLVEPRNLFNLEVWPCRIRTISHREVDQKLAPAQSFESNNKSRKEDQISLPVCRAPCYTDEMAAVKQCNGGQWDGGVGTMPQRFVAAADTKCRGGGSTGWAGTGRRTTCFSCVLLLFSGIRLFSPGPEPSEGDDS